MSTKIMRTSLQDCGANEIGPKTRNSDEHANEPRNSGALHYIADGLALAITIGEYPALRRKPERNILVADSAAGKRVIVLSCFREPTTGRRSPLHHR